MSIDSVRSPELTPEIKQQLVTQLGSQLHDEWRAPRKISIQEIDRQLMQAAEDNREASLASWGTQSHQENSSRALANELQTRRDYLAGLGSKEVFEPRIKATKDEAWKAARGVEKVDIANTSFADLPSDWRAAAEVAMGELFRQVESGGLLDDSFVEQAAATVHDKWLERNGSWAPAEQNKPFEELSEEEKEKDRVQVRKAIELYEAL
ncbi:MAG: hypothetical protein UR28_C0020G0034 [Candidatus Peregrinibacteria bacterium GW2011_GWF2_33_10]|nr:MAG: hypothetical protein UR28_C0020G0034 [Candidatus Peregrinibacteria bacterium GW2011_GWF2_33_10]OGJ45337.1 MAG: hypothetical protein A2272_06300 [Candidatus Peregrinibacteria bacterium RIFOXYA12_FULL_33_12]